MKAYVMEAYYPAGGTYMAYHLGRILQEGFAYEAVAVGTPPEQATMFDYRVAMPSVSVETMLESATASDLLVCNPSFSDSMYGLKLPCRKISYVQNVRTFRVLDVFFDHYVFVSEWVRRFIVAYYGIDGPVIPAFIDSRRFQSTVPWADRAACFLMSGRKHDGLVFSALMKDYRNRFPGPEPAFKLLPIAGQDQLAAEMAASRYMLSLDCMEGFGLPMLEAMSCGCAVVGWDSGGCHEYAKHEWNCLLARYGDIESLARNMRELLENEHLARTLADNARNSAEAFTPEAFDSAWRRYFSTILA